jgi:hypothetical protein
MLSPSPFTVMNQSQFEHPLTSDTEDFNSPFEPALIFSQDDVLNRIEAPLNELLEKLPKSPNNRYVIWKEDTANEWHQWWTAKIANNINRDIFRHMVWTRSKRSPIWTQFYQGAEIRTGNPKVLCQLCWRAFAHPELRQGGSSTSTLTRHTKSGACTRRDGSQTHLHLVSYLYSSLE